MSKINISHGAFAGGETEVGAGDVARLPAMQCGQDPRKKRFIRTSEQVCKDQRILDRHKVHHRRDDTGLCEKFPQNLLVVIAPRYSENTIADL